MIHSLHFSGKINLFFIYNSKKVVLLLSLSDYIPEDKYKNSITDEFSIYEISVEEPNTHLIKKANDIEQFSIVYRKVLNEIQAIHGKDSIIHIFPAVPASIAVQCGREILPTKDPSMLVYEFIKSENKFCYAMELE